MPRLVTSATLCIGVFSGGVVLSSCGDSDSSEEEDAATPVRQMQTQDAGETSLTFMCEQTSCEVPPFNPGFLLDAGVDLGGVTLEDLNLPPDLLGELVGITPEGCCVGEMGDVCGVTERMMLLPDGKCLEQAQVGKDDPDCPDEVTVIDGVDVPFKGCCKPDNTCGVDLTPIGVGCLERTLAAEVERNITGPSDAGTYEALSCNYTGLMDGGAESDAGDDDGG